MWWKVEAVEGEDVMSIGIVVCVHGVEKECAQMCTSAGKFLVVGRREDGFFPSAVVVELTAQGLVGGFSEPAGGGMAWEMYCQMRGFNHCWVSELKEPRAKIGTVRGMLVRGGDRLRYSIAL